MKGHEIISMYLNQNLKLVKEKLGGACKHLSFSKEKALNPETNQYETFDVFDAVMYNDFDGTDRVKYRIDKPLSQLNGGDFESLVFNLNSRAYEKDGAGDTETV